MLENKFSEVESLLSFTVAGISFRLLLLSFFIIIVTFAVRRYLVKYAFTVIEKATKNTHIKWDDELIKNGYRPLKWLVTIAGIWLALSVLNLPTKPVNLQLLATQFGKTAVVIILAWFFYKSVDTITKILKAEADDPKHWMDTSFIPLIVISIKVFIGILVTVLVAQNLGYSVSALVASLGIGGIAVALAAKDTLANLFGSIMLMIDRPFKLGQWIRSSDGTLEGIVEEIGFRSTTIRTFGKTTQVIPNNILANMVVENMDRRGDEQINLRRVKMNLGLEYSTTAKEMENAVNSIRGILENHDTVDKKLILVYFTEFGDFSLNLFIYYFVATTNWAKWLETRQDVNLKIMHKVDELGLKIAFPTQTIHIERQNPLKD